MINHIVLFSFKNPDDSFLKDISEKLCKLKKDIPEIIEISTGINENPDEAYHLALTVLLKDFNDLKVYANHPKHLAVGKLIREKIDKRACVDYRI